MRVHKFAMETVNIYDIGTCRLVSDQSKRPVIGPKRGWKLRTILKSKVFCDWSILNIWKINDIYKTGIYLLQFSKYISLLC